MDKQAFQELLQRYLQGKCTEAEIKRIHHWYDHLEQESPLSLSSLEQESLKKKLWHDIQADRVLSEAFVPKAKKGKPVNRWLKPVYYSGIAAMLALAFFLTWYFIQEPENKTSGKKLVVFEKEAKLLDKVNTGKKPQKIILEDGSEVILNPGSSIHYPVHFTTRREVYLEGDAFFNVAKNPAKPFFVYSDKVITQVLGTSFWVRAQDKNKVIQVEVKTGKVSVYENVSSAPETSAGKKHTVSKGVVLKPNQKATYFTENRHWETSIVEQPTVIESWEATAPVFVFNDTPLQEVVLGLEKGFGIEIITANEQLKTCTFTGDVTGLSLYEKLDLICKSIKATYEVRGTHIVINGEGCN